MVTGAGFGSSVELASSSIQQKWNYKLVKIDHLYLDLRGCRHFRDPQMTVGSKIDYRRNRAGIVTNTLYRGGNPKLEAGVFWQANLRSKWKLAGVGVSDDTRS
jgi:hypothetical protein